MKTTEEILTERGSQYGSYEGKASFIQAVKGLMRDAPSWGDLTPAMQESLDMIIHKASRILWGDPRHRDSWQDIIGYTELVVKALPVEAAPPVKRPPAYILPDRYVNGLDWANIEEPKFPVYKDKED